MYNLKLSNKAIQTLQANPNAQCYWLEKSGRKLVAWWDGVSTYATVEDGIGNTHAIISNILNEPFDFPTDLSAKGYCPIAQGIPYDANLEDYAIAVKSK